MALPFIESYLKIDHDEPKVKGLPKKVHELVTMYQRRGKKVVVLWPDEQSLGFFTHAQMEHRGIVLSFTANLEATGPHCSGFISAFPDRVIETIAADVVIICDVGGFHDDYLRRHEEYFSDLNDKCQEHGMQLHILVYIGKSYCGPGPKEGPPRYHVSGIQNDSTDKLMAFAEWLAKEQPGVIEIKPSGAFGDIEIRADEVPLCRIIGDGHPEVKHNTREYFRHKWEDGCERWTFFI